MARDNQVYKALQSDLREATDAKHDGLAVMQIYLDVQKSLQTQLEMINSLANSQSALVKESDEKLRSIYNEGVACLVK